VIEKLPIFIHFCTMFSFIAAPSTEPFTHRQPSASVICVKIKHRSSQNFCECSWYPR